MGLRISFDGERGFGDLVATAGVGLEQERGLTTAVLVSLFSWGPGGPDSPQPDLLEGWWGDTLPDAAGYRLAASKLWLLGSRRVSDETADLARGYAEEALAWMVADGVADRVEVQVSQDRAAGALGISVALYRPGHPAAEYLGPWEYELGGGS